MTSVISFTKELKTGPKDYCYHYIDGVTTSEYLRMRQLKQYREKQASKGRIVAKGANELADESSVVDAIREARQMHLSFRAIGRQLNVSRYKVQRICELQAID